MQIASNPRLVDENWEGEPAKFWELDAIVDEVVVERGEKLVVWTNYLGNVSELTERYGALGAAPYSGEVSTAARDQAVKEFQSGSAIKILVAVPAAGGVGITLTAAQTAVYLDKSWNGEHWMQSIDRVYRIGQKGSVNIISLHASRVDDLIAANLRRKEREQRALLGDDGRLRGTQLVASGHPTREELLEALQVSLKRS